MRAARLVGLVAGVAVVVAAITVAVRSLGHKSIAKRSGATAIPVDTVGWKTDFAKHNVPLKEFSSGGPPRDGIPPIDDPKFVAVDEAGEFLSAQEPVIAVSVGDEARAYPVQILIWHEIVNDELGEQPIAITFCPLCNSSLVFDRRVDGRVLRLGTTGNLRNSDLVMWDDATESWWQQLTGEAVVGELTGTKLRAIDSQTLAWKDFADRYPGGQVLSRETGYNRPYGDNPYAGYDDVDTAPFALDPDKLDKRLPPKLRVAAVTVGEKTVVAGFDLLERRTEVDTRVGGVPVVVFFKRGVRSALDNDVLSSGRDVGTASAFDSRVAGRTLSFVSTSPGRFRDKQTGSTWDITGRALSGKLEGQRLRPVPHDEQFWFAIAAFRPNARIIEKDN